MQLEPGQIIDGRFEVEALVGEGGLAEVYRVRHRELGRIMALKLLTWRKKSLIERLVLEGRIQAQLNHPNVVAVLDLVRHDGQVALLMEYIDAETLGEYIARVGPTPEDEALELLAPILAAVDCAHAAGITHRDLKPANIMLASVGSGVVPKVADFGIAKGPTSSRWAPSPMSCSAASKPSPTTRASSA
jgi:eukaryotic-like serine/threonine-protein kinase